MFEFERHDGGERALLVHVNFPHQSDQDDLAEFVELTRSADAHGSARHSVAPR